MSLFIRNEPDALMYATIKAYNGLLVAGVGSNFHACQSATCSGDYREPVTTSTTITTANATDLATSIALANAIMTALVGHFADGPALAGLVSAGAHKVADGTVVGTTFTKATDLASVQTLLNLAKTKYNTHIASTTFHYTADATNAVATANATDQTTANALANAIKTAFNAHMASGSAAQAIRIVPA